MTFGLGLIVIIAALIAWVNIEAYRERRGMSEAERQSEDLRIKADLQIW